MTGSLDIEAEWLSSDVYTSSWCRKSIYCERTDGLVGSAFEAWPSDWRASVGLPYCCYHDAR
jgi:hypothetical protein